MLGEIINQELKVFPYYIGYNHTSCYYNKYMSGVKKDINDTIIDNYNTGYFNGTLIPTNNQYLCSYIYPAQIVCDAKMINIKLHNKPGDVRIGSQSEILKSNDITHNVLNKHLSNNNNNVLISTDKRVLYAKNNEFKDILTKDNVFVNKLDLEIMSSTDDIKKPLSEKNISFSIGVKQPCYSVEVTHENCSPNAGFDPLINDIKIVNADSEAMSAIKQFKDSAINDCSNNYDDLVDDH